MKPWYAGTPSEVWDLAIEKVRAGDHLVHAVIRATCELWDEPPGTQGLIYQQEAPEVRALNVLREQEGAVVGVDHFGTYSVEQAIAALVRARES